MTHVIGYICCVCSKRKHAPGYICCRIKLNSFVISLCPITEIIPPPPGLHRLRQKREGQTHHKYQLCCYCWLLNEKYSRSNRENITQCYIMTDRLAKKIQLIPFRRCFKHGTFFGVRWMGLHDQLPSSQTYEKKRGEGVLCRKSGHLYLC